MLSDFLVDEFYYMHLVDVFFTTMDEFYYILSYFALPLRLSFSNDFSNLVAKIKWKTLPD